MKQSHMVEKQIATASNVLVLCNFCRTLGVKERRLQNEGIFALSGEFLSFEANRQMMNNKSTAPFSAAFVLCLSSSKKRGLSGRKGRTAIWMSDGTIIIPNK